MDLKQSVVASSSDEEKKSLERSKQKIEVLIFRVLIGSYALFFVEHPFFDELRNFSGLTYSLANHMIILLIMFGFLFIFLLDKLHNYENASNLLQDEDDDLYSSTKIFNMKKSDFWILLLRLAIDVTIAVFIIIVSLLLRFPSSVVPVNIVIGVALMELHFFIEGVFNKVLLTLIVFLAMTVTVVSFAKGTIYYILYSFQSYFFSSFQLSDFSFFTALMMAAAAIIPIFLLIPKRKRQSGITFSLSNDPKVYDDDKSKQEDNGVATLTSVLLSVGLVVFSMFSSWTELAILEQVSEFFLVTFHHFSI